MILIRGCTHVFSNFGNYSVPRRGGDPKLKTCPSFTGLIVLKIVRDASP